MGGAIYGMIIVTFKGSGAAVQKACGRSRALKRVQELQAAFKVQCTQRVFVLSHTESTENTENLIAMRIVRIERIYGVTCGEKLNKI